MNKDIDDKRLLEEYSRLQSLLSTMNGFLSKHSSISYIEFDYYTVHDLTLFSLEPDFDFETLKETIDKIMPIISAMKRIFGKPIINLKDTADVLPVETVHVINQETILHLANHSQNVADITSRGIKPRKLLTRVYEDDYGIYENAVFCNFVDILLKYCRRNLRALKDLVYANEIMEFNILERLNHLNYFLALGKLHTGYIRDFDKYSSISKTLYNRLLLIINAIQPRLNKPLYQKNKHRNPNLEVRKTNIFAGQKDYHQVYLAYKYFLNNKITAEEKVKKEDLDFGLMERNYFYFVEILSLFAIGHFNFETDPSATLDLNNLQASFTFKKWKAEIKNIAKEAVQIDIIKDKRYRIILAPSIDYQFDDTLLDFKEKYEADECIVCSPFEEEYLTRRSMFVSMENIESFRRLQQVILRGMIYADAVHADCPFCQGSLVLDTKNGIYECDSCRTQIKEADCPESGKKYYFTRISNLKKIDIKQSDFSRSDLWLYQRKVESSMYFRNITKIDSRRQIICPICGKTHEDKKT